jgi:hypothetical protein
MERKPAVAVVFHHIGPDHHARLNAAAGKLSMTGVEWSAKAADAWGSADSPARYHKLSLFRKQQTTTRGRRQSSKRSGRLWSRRILM